MFLREGGIYMKKKIAALCAALCVMSLAAGCGKKEDVLDKNDPVTITVWNYYNGAQLDSFNELVEKFNSTVGKEKGIKVGSRTSFERCFGQYGKYAQISAC